MRRRNLAAALAMAGLDRSYADSRAELATESESAAEVFDDLVDANAPGILGAANDDGRRFDSQTLAMVARQLEHVMTETYDEPFPELRMAEGQVVPIDTSVPEGAESFVYYLYSAVGVAKFSSGYSSGAAPRVAITGARVTGRVEAMENAYAYTARDLRNAAFANLPLESNLAVAARRGHSQLLQDVGLWGREDIGIPGFVNHLNITITNAPNDGNGSSRLWADKTVDQIIRDVNLLINTVEEVSFGMRTVTDVLLPRAEMLRIKTTRLGAGDGGMTILKFIQEAHPAVTFGVLNELAASLSSGNLATDSALAYVKDKKLASLVVPMPFRQYPVQQQGLEYVIPCESSTGGIKLVEPLTVHRLDGIGDS